MEAMRVFGMDWCYISVVYTHGWMPNAHHVAHRQS